MMSEVLGKRVTTLIDKRILKLSALSPFIMLLFFSCGGPIAKKNDEPSGAEVENNLFSIKDSAGLKIITVNSPFAGSMEHERYVLYSKEAEKPVIPSATQIIATPIERIGINSTTHLGFLNAIHQAKSVAAATNLGLYYDSNFVARVARNEVIDIGSRNLNTEKVIASELDVLFSFAIDAASYQEVKRLRALGIPVVLVSEFLESNPLAKADWLSFFAAFYNSESQAAANDLMQEVNRRYDSIKKAAIQHSSLSTVAIGLPWKGTWYVSGVASYQAKLIQDASCSYLWKDYKQNGSVPIDIETALSRSVTADFWINPGAIKDANELTELNEQYSSFNSFKKGNIYSNYKRSNSSGANDYWESGVVRPDLILEDLVKITHSKSIDSENLTFYKSIFND